MKPVTVPFFISHQGCPHTCVFCDQHTISGSAGILPTPDEILSKVEAWRQSSGDRPLDAAFFGGTFTALDEADQQRLLDPLQPLLARGVVRSVRISTRPDCLDGYRADWLRERGVTTVELGVQSLDGHVLAASGRGHTAAASVAAILLLKERGMTVVAQLMPGLPEDTPRSSLNSLEGVVDAGADVLRIYPAVVLAGTDLDRLWREGRYRPLGLDEGIALCAVLLQRAMARSVPVLRIGLQADQGLTDDTAVAGCWHPALGELVLSRLYGDLLMRLCSEAPPLEALLISCHPSRVSAVAGHGRCNLKRVAHGRRCRVIADILLENDEVMVNFLDRQIKGSVIADLDYNLQMRCNNA